MSRIVDFLNVSEEQKVKVREYYKKSKEDVQKDVDILLEWLNKQPHLPKPFDAVRVESFLVKNKFRIEKTKLKLDKYYTLKGVYPKFYEHADVDSEAIQNNFKAMIWFPLPKQLPTLERIFYFTFIEKDATFYDILNACNYLMIMLEFVIYDYCVCDRMLWDFSNLSMKHMTKLDPMVIAQAFRIYQEAFSGRVSFIEVINLSPSMDILIKLFKKVLPAKIFERLRIHKDLDSLYEVIPKEYLPKEYDGNQDSVYELQEKFIKELQYHKDILLENIKKQSNEKLRIGKLPNHDLFGVDGTFKNLNLD